MTKKALITGCTGQDGSYLAELLLSKDYEVHGIIRKSSCFNTSRIDHIFHDLCLHYGDLSDSSSIGSIVDEVQPDELYHLGAMSHVRVSFDIPEYSSDIDAIGTLRVVEAVRKFSPHSKMYNAASSEMFGATPAPQNEETVFNPQSPYACSKVFSHNIVRNYRKAYGLFMSNGILFNHESPRRGETFVTRKVTRAIGRILSGLQDRLYLGNLDAKRDWGHAKDYVYAMWLMLQHDEPDDFVIATGETHSVKEFVQLAFEKADLDFKKYVEIDQRYFRPSEVDELLGDSSKARKVLNWKPKFTYEGLIEDMLNHDIKLAKQEHILLSCE